MTAPTISVNDQFRDDKHGQIEAARAAVAANTQALADYDSGAAQARLDATLAQQLAAGKIRMVGPGRYESLEGWDRNEIFTVQRATKPGQLVLVLPETGLDRSADGTRDLLYTAVVPWHNAQGVGLVPGGTCDIDKVLELGGLNWEVDQRDVRYYAGGELRTMPGRKVNTRTDTFAPLGVVGSGWTPMQPRESMGFLQELAGSYDIPFESAGPLEGGRKIFVSMRLPDGILIDPEGINEHTELFLAVMDAFDATASFQSILTPWRTVCGNTNRFALRDASARWRTRHSKNIAGRVDEAKRTMNLSAKYAGAYSAEETALARTDIVLGEVDKLIAGLWPAETDPTEKQRQARSRQLDTVFERFELEASRVGQTAYALENAITGYVDHDRPRHVKAANMAAAKATQILTGTDDDIKSRAHRQLLTLTNR